MLEDKAAIQCRPADADRQEFEGGYETQEPSAVSLVIVPKTAATFHPVADPLSAPPRNHAKPLEKETQASKDRSLWAGAQGTLCLDEMHSFVHCYRRQ